MLILCLLSAAAALSATSPALAQPPRGPRGSAASTADPVPGLRGFGIVLVQGEMQSGTPSGDTVPAAALKALNDLKDFLPYKNYRLLDTQWTMGVGHMSGTLRGPENASYNFEVEARRGNDAPLIVSKFVLRAAPAGDDRLAALTAARGLASQMPADQLYVKLAPWGRNLIDTSFGMDIGETVVVGTSRLQGSNALIVLLTAVSKTAAAK